MFLKVRGVEVGITSMYFGVSVSRSFFDRLGVGVKADVGAAWAPKWGLC